MVVSALFRGWKWDGLEQTNSRLTVYLNGTEYGRFEIGGHTRLNSVTDGKNVRINSRNVTQTSGDHSGVQIKPNQTVATAGITGLEVSPRFAAGIAGVSLVAIKADPVLKGGSGGNLSGAVTAVEANIDFGTSDTRVITGDVSAFSAFLAIPSGNTYSGRIAFLRVKTINIKAWDDFLNVDDASTGVAAIGSDNMTKNPQGDTEDGYLTVRVAGTSYQIPLYAA